MIWLFILTWSASLTSLDVKPLNSSIAGYWLHHLPTTIEQQIIIVKFCEYSIVVGTKKEDSLKCLKGIIVDHNMNPLVGCEVRIYRYEKPLFRTLTNDRGEYQIDDLKPERYMVEVSHFSKKEYVNVVEIFPNDTVVVLNTILDKSSGRRGFSLKSDYLNLNLSDSEFVIDVQNSKLIREISNWMSRSQGGLKIFKRNLKEKDREHP